MIDKTDLQALIELSEKADQGEWSFEFDRKNEHNVDVYRVDTDGDTVHVAEFYSTNDSAAFICALVNWFRANHSTLTAPTLPGAGGGDALDAARYREIRDAHSLLQIYVYDDPADAGSGEWRYKPSPESVDQFCDELIIDRAALAALPPQQGG